MAEDMDSEANAPKRKGKKGLAIGLVLALVLGAGGFYATFSGMILGSGDAAEDHAQAGEESHDSDGDPAQAEIMLEQGGDITDVAFLPVTPIVVSLTGPNASRHLRFRAELEVAKEQSSAVEHLMPRVMDVMNAYLRALDPDSLNDAGALIELRAQLLRRVALVVGANRVRDVLVMEFVLS
ncbi:flagellar basal body-associated protein FliL [Palleronia sp.]|uniref:flagellar basal body-associated FliL family protein n=1 Tax=Palleronia sp. TaxID=1940284 RepID=UPI0035C84C9E